MRVHGDNADLPPMDFVVGAAEQLQDLGLSGFDLIAARQSACYFPIRSLRLLICAVV